MKKILLAALLVLAVAPAFAGTKHHHRRHHHHSHSSHSTSNHKSV
ncbi:MAG TPA: hypothetical protein VMD29_11705 [Terracidiphilus sp.]|nr:hypothetical protein [Terracidiphilus sp.]